MGKLSVAGYIEIVSKSKNAIDVQKKAGSLFSRKLKALVKNWSCHWKLLYFREVLPGGFPLSYVFKVMNNERLKFNAVSYLQINHMFPPRGQ